MIMEADGWVVKSDAPPSNHGNHVIAVLFPLFISRDSRWIFSLKGRSASGGRLDPKPRDLRV